VIQINDLKRDPSNNVVVSVQWDIVVNHEDAIISKSFNHDLPHKDPDDDSFLNYDDLSEDDVVQWISEIVGEDFIFQQEEKMRERIVACKAQAVQSGVPWVREEDLGAQDDAE